MGHEGHEIADWLNKKRNLRFYLRLQASRKGVRPSLPDDGRPASHPHRSKRMQKKWKVDPEKNWNHRFFQPVAISRPAVRPIRALANSTIRILLTNRLAIPNFAILCYGRDWVRQAVHASRFTTEPNRKRRRKRTGRFLFKRRTKSQKRTPPCFLWHTTADKGVPVENSIQFYLACKNKGVSAALHVFDKGRHGIGLAKGMKGAEAWPKLCIDWIAEEGFTGRGPCQIASNAK